MTEHFAPFQEIFARIVSKPVASAYERLLAAGSVPEQEAAAFCGGEENKKALADYGLARTIPESCTDGYRFTATPVNLAFQGLLGILNARHAELIDLISSTTRAAVDAHGRDCGIPPGEHDLTREIHDRHEISKHSAGFISSARKDFLTLDNGYHDTHRDEEFPVNPVPYLAGKVRMRGVYDESFTATEAGRRHLDSAVERGEEVRVVQEVPMKMQIADKAAAMIGLSPTAMGGVLIAHASLLVDVLRDKAEDLWERGSAWDAKNGNGDGQLTEEQKTIIHLLRRGATDARIGEEFKITESAANHRVRDIGKILKADTRWQSGWEARDRGWFH